MRKPSPHLNNRGTLNSRIQTERPPLIQTDDSTRTHFIPISETLRDPNKTINRPNIFGKIPLMSEVSPLRSKDYDEGKGIESNHFRRPKTRFERKLSNKMEERSISGAEVNSNIQDENSNRYLINKMAQNTEESLESPSQSKERYNPRYNSNLNF